MPRLALDEMAESLLLDPNPFRRLIKEPGAPLDRAFVLDVVASLAFCQAVDPNWLLTGRYNSSIHRQVLEIGEARGLHGLLSVREFVQEQFERQRRDTPSYLEFLSWNPFRTE